MGNSYPVLSVLPNEYIESYTVRLAHITGAPPKTALTKLRTQKNFHLNLMEGHSIAASELYREHSLVPLINSIPELSDSDDWYNFKRSLKLSGDSFKACPKCRRKDLEEHGFFYFRTQHQPMGITKCTLHNASLDNYSKHLLKSEPLGERAMIAPSSPHHPSLIDIYHQAINTTLTQPNSHLSLEKSINYLREKLSLLGRSADNFLDIFSSDEHDQQPTTLLESVDRSYPLKLKRLFQNPAYRSANQTLVIISLLCLLAYEDECMGSNAVTPTLQALGQGSLHPTAAVA